MPETAGTRASGSEPRNPEMKPMELGPEGKTWSLADLAVLDSPSSWGKGTQPGGWLRTVFLELKMQNLHFQNLTGKPVPAWLLASMLKPCPRLLLFADMSLKALTEHQHLSSLEQQYNQEITDLKQPVLVSQPKRRRGPGGTLPGPAMLIPELCYLTGASRVSPRLSTRTPRAARNPHSCFVPLISFTPHRPATQVFRRDSRFFKICL